MLWDELDALNPVPVCTCNSCTCNIIQRIHKIQEESILKQFLMKLSPEFTNVRGNILLQSPLPTISHAYRLLMQEERHKQLYQANHAEDESMAFNANKKRFSEQSYGQRNNNKFNFGGYNSKFYSGGYNSRPSTSQAPHNRSG